ncbi:VOC family protein [Endozoicomonas sp. G2_2]|uniref:VOC family protein n=1 Tax=Endozoicomonas sp. G2_2 TaxID=2821092 RepID=UPI001ADA7093|nr:VOC family protein [Endozoicomonas sp. G2_2]
MSDSANHETSPAATAVAVTLDHATLRTGDLAGHRQFFRRLLGLQPGYRPDFGFPGYWLYAGETPLVHLIPNQDLEQRDAKETIDHIAFRVHDIDSATQRAVAGGYVHSRSDLPALGERRLFVQTPTGLRIELVERVPDNRLRTDTQVDHDE